MQALERSAHAVEDQSARSAAVAADQPTPPREQLRDYTGSTGWSSVERTRLEPDAASGPLLRRLHDAVSVLGSLSQDREDQEHVGLQGKKLPGSPCIVLRRHERSSIDRLFI